jgi:uncharacterized protein (TIGR02266 family)
LVESDPASVVDPGRAGSQYPGVAALPLIRVRLKHADEKAFVERFAANVTRGGVFLASREPRPVGSLVRFEVCLVSGQVVLSGEGRVTWVKPYNANEPARPHGMGVQFTELEAASRPMLERLLVRREATGKRPSPPPAPVRPSPWQAERRSNEPVSSEFDSLEETALRRALDRARVLADRPDDDAIDKQLENLLQGEPDAPTTLDQALGELPRFLARGRGSGLFRISPETAQMPAQTAEETPAGATHTNGKSPESSGDDV